MISIPKYATGANVRDKEWVRKTFMLGTANMADTRFRLQTLATQKFTDTRLGGNMTINNIPQYTRSADIRVSGLNAENQILDDDKNVSGQHLGMGRFYSEQIDDNSQQIFLQFGVPEYNGMFSFFTGFYDNEAGLLANEGLGKYTYYAGFAIGLVVSVAFFPVLLVGSVASWFLARPTSRYYYMKEAMPLYWNRVNLICNTLGVNMGLVPRINQQYDSTKIEFQAGETNDEWRSYAHALAPDIFRKNGGINIYAVANKAQRLADKRYALQQEIFTGEGIDRSVWDKLKGFITGDYGTPEERAQMVAQRQATDSASTRLNRDIADDNSLAPYLEEYHKLAIGNKATSRNNPFLGTDVSELKAEDAPPRSNTQQLRSTYGAAATEEEEPELLKGYAAKDEASFLDYWKANQREGSNYVGFKVDYTGTVGESFSNSTKEPEISNKINGISGSARSARFSFSDGNTGFGIVDEAVNAAKGLVSGVLDSVHLSGLLSLAGSAFVDIPQVWSDSSATFPTASYNIELRAPYGHVLSRYMNLHVPLACILAGVLPLSTGKQSYSSPFLCSLFCKGKNQIRLGMIDSVSITRGAGNLGWNNNGECLGIDVSFTIKDLSSILHAPIDPGFNPLKPWKGMLFDDDSAFKDYMAVLGNLSLADQTYGWRKLFINLTKKREAVDTFFSRAHFAQATSNNFLTRLPGTMYGIATRAGNTLINN